jgi:hypothetical protein
VSLAIAVMGIGAVGSSAEPSATRAPIVEIDGDGDPHAGHVTVAWSAPSAGDAPLVFQLEEAASQTFDPSSLRYEGRQQSSVISGLPDGKRFFRARARQSDGAWGPWSDTYIFRTRHHSLALASSLFAIGAVAFGLTAAFVVGGARNARRTSHPEDLDG